jgi:guanylate kinase
MSSFPCPLLVVIAGLSCAGKSTTQRILAHDRGVPAFPKYLTRPPRPFEQMENCFISRELFLQKQGEPDFISYAKGPDLCGFSVPELIGTLREKGAASIIVTDPAALARLRRRCIGIGLTIGVLQLQASRDRREQFASLDGETGESASRRIARDAARSVAAYGRSPLDQTIVNDGSESDLCRKVLAATDEFIAWAATSAEFIPGTPRSAAA